MEEKKRIIKNASENLVNKITQILEDFKREIKVSENLESSVEG